MKKFLLVAVASIAFLSVGAESIGKWVLSDTGAPKSLIFENQNKKDTVIFFTGEEKTNPTSFYTVDLDGNETVGRWSKKADNTYTTSLNDVECQIKYDVINSVPAMVVTLTNRGNIVFQPRKAGLKSGIDTNMKSYPQWLDHFFPTFMRNEKSHFYGYLQRPKGDVLVLASEEPIASWSVDYNLGYRVGKDSLDRDLWFYGHRIMSLNLDFINALPLPDRHPQDLWKLAARESKTWTIFFMHQPSLDNLEKRVSAQIDAPVIWVPKSSYEQGNVCSISVFSKNAPTVTVTSPSSIAVNTNIVNKGDNMFEITATLSEIGNYTFDIASDNKQAEVIVAVHAPWGDVLKKARAAALRYHQKGTSHAESWYGFYSAFIARKYFPNEIDDKAASERFDYLFGLLHDTVKMEPLYYKSRIQNTSTTIGMLVDRYEATGNIKDLEKASRLADWMITFSQRKDGAYCNHGTIYTSVIYIAKSVLELVDAERQAAKIDRRWGKKADVHYLSAKRAIDQLVSSQGDFQTEGELTFEDGMISCSALQIGALALMQKDPKQRQHYANAMLDILNSHECLTQQRVPDARRRQGTMRFWEAQYDVFMLPNMFNSPHGWSGWRAYATYYAYLLTGEEKWLRETFNAMGAFAALFDKNGKLHWAFVVDPYLHVEQSTKPDSKYTADSLSFDNPHPRRYSTRKFTIGEQYVDMISDWQGVNSQDNDVHELFKCMGESVLTNAFIIEQPDGTIAGYNCNVDKNGDIIVVTPRESQITNLHCNLKTPITVKFNGRSEKITSNSLRWF